MSFKAILDISSIIWNKEDYAAHTNEYYQLKDSILTLFDKLESEKPQILLRNELLDEMISGFPFDSMPAQFNDFGNRVYSFLANIGSDIIVYPNEHINGTVSIPDLVHDYYSPNTKTEVNYLISRIYTQPDANLVYFTFKYHWADHKGKLKTKNERLSKDEFEYETIIVDNGDQIDKFLLQFKLIFDHHTKHDRIKPGEYESALSCFNGQDTTAAQKLLDSAIKSGKSYYNYDTDNNVWVVFRCHEKNKHHGFDQQNRERIPPEVRKCFNK